ncbi:hypothetical protein AQUCO_01000467v1 [Aquilegia coerulea]|uniref:Sulfite exporter TauE/SafE family protein n=1 Tax=Aquilegia coerulea TaxID=218851 RepID=A0A2G5EA78_AQUCA|nr:hypothetical protein AQUCO_01000467v1 [Aquilegia coerulea]
MVGIKVNKNFAGIAWFLCWSFVFLTELSRAERLLNKVLDDEDTTSLEKKMIKSDGLLVNLISFFWPNGIPSYHHVWPELEFDWKLVVGTIIGFFGAAMGSIGGVGGGGIFVPMLTLIIGFDPKSSTAISKCMIMGAAGSTVYYNLRLRHPTLDLPIIDYDLALLFQPMLMLGISIGVVCNIIFADWMVTILLIILFLGTSTKALIKGVETWNQETIMKKEAAELLKSESYPSGGSVQDYSPLPSRPAALARDKVPLVDNIHWKDFTVLMVVWVAFLVIHMAKVPIAICVSLYEAICLYKGKRVIASIGKDSTHWKVHQLFLYCFCGIIAGIVGGLLGLGGGFILGPLFLELGVPPQVASATSSFAMAFSSSMSVIQYYLLRRFPVPYAAYFVLVATIAALTGQHIVRKLIMLLGRASLIIFVLSLIIFVSAISLGGVGIANMVEKVGKNEHIGFENLCLQS